MPFKPEDHLRSLKGQQYLDVKFRLIWLRSEFPHSTIDTDLVTYDPDKEGGFYIFKAKVTLIDDKGEIHGSATGYGTQTHKAFPSGAAEKGETKAIGRALAACGLGTQFALEPGDDDDGESNLADSPVAKTAPPPTQVQQPPISVAQLKSILAGLLAKDAEGAGKIPKLVEDMSETELNKSINWLRNRATTRGQ